MKADKVVGVILGLMIAAEAAVLIFLIATRGFNNAALPYAAYLIAKGFGARLVYIHNRTGLAVIGLLHQCAFCGSAYNTMQLAAKSKPMQPAVIALGVLSIAIAGYCFTRLVVPVPSETGSTDGADGANQRR